MGNPERKRPHGRLKGVDWRIKLKYTLKKGTGNAPNP